MLRCSSSRSGRKVRLDRWAVIMMRGRARGFVRARGRLDACGEILIRWCAIFLSRRRWRALSRVGIFVAAIELNRVGVG